MTYEELQQWLASHGGWRESIPTTESSVNPLTKLPENKAVTMVVAADGSQIKVEVSGGGSRPEDNTYTVIGEPKLAAPRAAAGPTATNSEADRALDAENQREREWNRANGGLYETHKERREREAKEAPKPATAAETDTTELLRQKQRNQAAGAGYFTDEEISKGITDKQKADQTKSEAEKKDQETKAEAARKDQETKRNTWKPVGRESVKNEQTGVTETVTMEENGLGERRPITDKQTVIAKPEANPPIGRLPKDTHLGNISRGVMEAAQEIHDDPNLTPQEKIKAYDILEKYGTMFANEDEAILRSQQNTLSNQTSQRNTDIQEAASRRNFSSNLLESANKNTLTKVADPSTVAPAFMAQIELGIMLAKKLGGLNTYDRVQPGVASQQVMGMGLGGQQQVPQQQAQPQQPQASPGGGITINNISPPQMPQFVQQSTPEQIPGGGFLPPGNNSGLRFDGGQLRAPGYTAPEPLPEEAQIPEWMQQYA